MGQNIVYQVHFLPTKDVQRAAGSKDDSQWHPQAPFPFPHAIIPEQTDWMCQSKTSPQLCWRQSFLASRRFRNSYIKSPLCSVTQNSHSWIGKTNAKEQEEGEDKFNFSARDYSCIWHSLSMWSARFAGFRWILCQAEAGGEQSGGRESRRGQRRPESRGAEAQPCPVCAPPARLAGGTTLSLRPHRLTQTQTRQTAVHLPSFPPSKNKPDASRKKHLNYSRSRNQSQSQQFVHSADCWRLKWLLKLPADTGPWWWQNTSHWLPGEWTIILKTHLKITQKSPLFALLFLLLLFWQWPGHTFALIQHQ